MSIQIKSLNSIPELDFFESEWLKFEEQHFNLSQNYYLVKKYIETFYSKDDSRFGFNKKILVILVYEDGTLKLIIPLFIVKRFFKKIIPYISIETLTNAFAMPYQRFIGIAEEKYFNEVKTWISQNFKYDILSFTHLDKNYIKTIKSGENIIHGICPIVDLSEFKDYAEYNKVHYNSKTRYNIQSRKKKFISAGGALLKKTIHELSDDEFLQIRKVSATKELDHKHDHLSDERVVNYVKSLLAKYSHSITIARLNEKIVGYQISYFFEKTKFLESLAYDRNFKSFGIGNLIDDFEISSLDFNSINKINMGAGTDSYKLSFATKMEELYMHIDYGNRMFSKIICSYILGKYKKNAANFKL